MCQVKAGDPGPTTGEVLVELPEATRTQQVTDWIASHQRTFHHFRA